MSALRLGLPLAAAVFFIWKARKSRIYLLGIPCLLYMRESVFLDDLRVFSMPHRLSQATIMLVWLVFVWLLSTDLLLPRVKGSRPRILGPRLLPEETVLVLIAGLILVGTVVTAIEQDDLSLALGQAAGMLYLLVGYVLIRAIVSQVPAKEVVDFLWAVVVLNTIVACLFILHQGLGLHVYTLGEYHFDVFQGVLITRTFSFMPPLFFLALAFTFAQRKWDVPTYLVAGMNIVAVLCPTPARCFSWHWSLASRWSWSVCCDDGRPEWPTDVSRRCRSSRRWSGSSPLRSCRPDEYFASGCLEPPPRHIRSELRGASEGYSSCMHRW